MFKKISLPILLIIAACAFSGCALFVAGAAGGAGTAVWLSNKLTQDFNRSFEQGIRASREALQSLNLRITKETISDSTAQFRSAQADGDQVWVDVRRIADNACKIDVRVGIPGNEVEARAIMDAIAQRL